MASRRRIAYAPGVDGLRAVAVLAVIIFHAGATWLPGGFLGVDVFFVISGFLITSLLFAEHERDGRISFGGFWSRRARRLLPALLALLGVLTIWATSTWADPIQKRSFPGDAIASLFYGANWKFAAQATSYFDSFTAPSPLQHLWSLAIEEQFYIVWPLVVAALLASRRIPREKLLAVSLIGAAASMVLMAVLYNPVNPSAVYFRTDTHAFGLLLGASAALWLRGDEERRSRACARVAPFALVGVLGCLALMDGTQAFAYHGGIALAALLTVPVVVAAARPGALARVLSWRPLVAVGLISYGLYLWHWPIWTVLTDERLALAEPLATLARVAILIALTLGSYWLLELPIRRGAPRGWGAGIAVPATVGIVAVGILSVSVPPPVFTPSVVVAAGATTETVPAPRAPRVLIVGDSTAASAASGFVDTAAGAFEVIPAGMPPKTPDSYCPLDVGAESVREPDGRDHQHPLSPECDWPTIWPRLVRVYDPSVVVMLFSLWDSIPHKVNGRWLDVGSADWDAELTAAATCAVDLASERGARVLIVLAPRTIVQKGGGNEALNAVYRNVAAADPARVGVIDDREVIESGHQLYRWDGIHHTPEGARALAQVTRPALDAALAQPRLTAAPTPVCRSSEPPQPR